MSDVREALVNEDLSKEVLRRVRALAVPNKYVEKEKGKPLEDFFFAVLRFVDPERYGSLSIMNADPRWAYADACIETIKKVLDEVDEHDNKVLAAGLVGEVPNLLTVTVCFPFSDF